MSGITLAIISGIGFAFFQLFHRRAGAGARIDSYQATFVLLAVCLVILALASAAFEDLSLLAVAPLSAYLFFSLAGLIHFFVGWTFLSISQTRVGAARTGALVGSTPLFATILGFIFLDELLSLMTVAGILAVVVGVYLVSHG